MAVSACTVHQQETPGLSGPSELGTSISIAVSPDVLTQDGASQSIVTITARNSNGQPFPNLSLRTEISVGGAITDFGRLSARSVVTDASGRATVVYTAPPAPAVNVDNGTKVDIVVTPSGTNADNTNERVASIRLVPPGVVGAPPSPYRPEFSVPAAVVGDVALFSATVTDASGVDVTNQIVSYSWNFGDGDTASGRNASHTFDDPGAFPVSLTVVDLLGRRATVTHSVLVGAPANVTAVFFTTPAAPVSGQSITFNASQTTPPPGHAVTGYFWDFGDATGGATGIVVAHTFASPGTYTVLLRVTLDNGAQAVTTQTITVAPPNPKAVINLSPPTGTPGQTITFLGNKSTPAAGRTIVNYTWNFGDGSAVVSGTTSTVAHAYGRAGTYTVTLLVTDDQGNQDLATAQITIQ